MTFPMRRARNFNKEGPQPPTAETLRGIAQALLRWQATLQLPAPARTRK